MARAVFARAGFTGDSLDTILGISYAESDGGYADAVGDVTLVDEKWGPSVGLNQVRSLRNPRGFGPTDNWRIAFALRHPDFNATAAYEISRRGTNFEAWSMFKNGRYLQFKGKDFEIRTGHERAHQWNI